MKKLILLGAVTLFCAVNAQTGFNVGAHVGLPVGDNSDYSSVALGVDASYLWPVADKFSVGVISGYQAWLGKDYSETILGTTYTVKGETTSLVPIAATANYMLADKFSLGLDLGYGLVFGGNNSDGGFYYQPKVAYTLGKGNVWLGYQGLSINSVNFGTINLGYSFNLNN